MFPSAQKKITSSVERGQCNRAAHATAQSLPGRCCSQDVGTTSPRSTEGVPSPPSLFQINPSSVPSPSYSNKGIYYL